MFNIFKKNKSMKEESETADRVRMMIATTGGWNPNPPKEKITKITDLTLEQFKEFKQFIITNKLQILKDHSDEEFFVHYNYSDSDITDILNELEQYRSICSKMELAKIEYQKWLAKQGNLK